MIYRDLASPLRNGASLIKRRLYNDTYELGLQESQHDGFGTSGVSVALDLGRKRGSVYGWGIRIGGGGDVLYTCLCGMVFT